MLSSFPVQNAVQGAASLGLPLIQKLVEGPCVLFLVVLQVLLLQLNVVVVEAADVNVLLQLVVGLLSLCSETAIVFSFPGRAEALPEVGFSWEIGDSCRKSGQNQRFTGQSEKRPESGLSAQRNIPLCSIGT